MRVSHCINWKTSNCNNTHKYKYKYNKYKIDRCAYCTASIERTVTATTNETTNTNTTNTRLIDTFTALRDLVFMCNCNVLNMYCNMMNIHCTVMNIHYPVLRTIAHVYSNALSCITKLIDALLHQSVDGRLQKYKYIYKYCSLIDAYTAAVNHLVEGQLQKHKYKYKYSIDRCVYHSASIGQRPTAV